MRRNSILIREYDNYNYLASYNSVDYDLILSVDYDLILTVYPDSLACFILKNRYSNKTGYATIDYVLSLDISLESTLRLTKYKNKIMENIRC